MLLFLFPLPFEMYRPPAQVARDPDLNRIFCSNESKCVRKLGNSLHQLEHVNNVNVNFSGSQTECIN